MLTADLVRSSVRKGTVLPTYIDADKAENIELARQLIGIFEESIGEPRRVLQSKLEDLLGTGTAFLLHRGLAKLLFDRCDFATSGEVDLDPTDLRGKIFAEAASIYTDSSRSFDRDAVMESVARDLGLEQDAPGSHLLESHLFADLKDEQCLTEMRSITAEKLVRRYNTALAQAVLLRASELVLRIREKDSRRCRALFRAIRFHRLLHRIEGDAESGYTVRLDGPLSLFHASQRYGMQMANFLPTLLHFDDWELEADVLWGKQRARRLFRLSPKTGLTSHTPLQGQWQPEELGWFLTQFEKLGSDWEIREGSRVVDLSGNGVFIPDFHFVHATTGIEVFMEIFGFWRRSAVVDRVRTLVEHGPGRLILALSKELHAEKEAIADLPAHVYVFRSHPIARDVLKLLEQESASDDRG